MHNLSPEAVEVVKLLARGGSLVPAGLTGTRWVIWKGNAIASGHITLEVAQELEAKGMLTEKGDRLSLSKRTQAVLAELKLR